jgi:hypothetical protein
VVWTTESDEVAWIAVHQDGAVNDDWTSQGIPVTGLSLGDDELSVAASERRGTVYAVLRTSLDEVTGGNDLAPQLILLQFPLTGAPTAHLVARVEDKHTDPIVVLDADQDVVHVVAASRGAIYYKDSDLDEIRFASGMGIPLMVSQELDARLTQPTSTKEVTADRELVVLAADRDVGRYYYGALEDEPSESPVAPSAPSDVQLAHDTFEGVPVGTPLGGSWILNTGPPEALSVVMLTSEESSARLTGGPPGETLRACRSFPTTSTGTIIVGIDVLLNLIPSAQRARGRAEVL